jgi:hypothetical protein
VGLLAKHDFDLRGKIGTILAEKYDFTGVEGMRQAYSAAFGKRATIEAAFSSDRLLELEAVRHSSLTEPVWLTKSSFDAQSEAMLSVSRLIWAAPFSLI